MKAKVKVLLESTNICNKMSERNPVQDNHLCILIFLNILLVYVNYQTLLYLCKFWETNVLPSDIPVQPCSTGRNLFLFSCFFKEY